MSVAKSPLVKLEKSELVFSYSDIHGAKEAINFFFKDKDEISIFDHLHFGYSFSSSLHEVYRTEEYRNFIKKYNHLTKRRFSETINFVNDLFTLLGLRVNPLAVMNKPDFFIKDMTDIFNGDEFSLEKDLENNIYEFMKLWDNGWVVHRQKDIGYGRCDIALDSNSEKVALELKKGKAERKDVYQALEYSKGDSGYKPILVASSFSDDVVGLAKEYRLNCYEYAFGRTKGFEIPYVFYLLPAYEFGHETKIDDEFREIVHCDGFIVEFDIPPSNIAHELANEELRKFISASEALVEHEKKKPKTNICPLCKTDLSKKEVI